jgi:hypothetical protein
MWWCACVLIGEAGSKVIMNKAEIRVSIFRLENRSIQANATFTEICLLDKNLKPNFYTAVSRRLHTREQT